MTHCWALRDQAAPVGWGLSGWLLFLLCCCVVVDRVVGLVGLLFEICIVDASIFVAIVWLCM